MTLSAALAAVLACLALSAAGASTTLFDFERPEDLAAWRYEGRAGEPVREIALSRRFATSGNGSLAFSVPAWRAGMAEWPAFEHRSAGMDLSGSDRLTYDITNASGAAQRLMLLVSGSGKPTRDGIWVQTHLPPFSLRRVVVPLSELQTRGIKSGEVTVMHFFTERPPADMEVYIDRIAVLKPGEALPDLPASYLEQARGLAEAAVRQAAERIAEADLGVPRHLSGSPEAVALESRRAALVRKAARLTATARGAGTRVLAVPEDAAKLEAEAGALARQGAFLLAFARVRPQVQVGSDARTDVAVGFATSMEKVLPRAMSTSPEARRSVELSLARRERESLQVVVMPTARALKRCEVRVDTLRDAGGRTLPASAVTTCVVGYVETKAVPPYGTSHVGWWPDPLLEFQRSADIAPGDAQAFWVRVHAPANQPAGTYRGKLTVLADGKPAYSFDLAVRVYDFSVPIGSPLPLAVTFAPMKYEPDGAGGWVGGDTRDTSWKAHRQAWGQMLADYYLTYDTLYGNAEWQPEWDVLARLKQQGRLGRFNLGYYSVCGETPEQIAEWRKAHIDVIRPRYERAKELGILDQAYIYGCDEHPADQFPGVQRAAEMLKREFPGVPILTTTYDDTFGIDTVIKAMDGFCPLTARYTMEGAARGRAAGKQVWWYICCAPHSPHANMFVEYPAIEGRLLMGAMTAKYRPDGFLYYETSIWNSPPIASGPFTNWDPRSWTTYHGDGSWTCMGPGGTPLPTIRLENFRDGLEDYAYVLALEDAVKRVEAAAPERTAWLAQARALVAVPTTLVRSLTEYSRDPAALYAWRSEVAEAIEEAGAHGMSRHP